MSDIIQLLPDTVANQIAAGEVIQRPASVIKELVENAVDAGAETIHVSVTDAGRTSIQVIDDGCGMSDTDARLSFERHATSKIRKADDLFALHTMGFRGEALASIAAVAQIELRTRLRGTQLGTRLSVSGFQFTGQEPVSCAEGTNITVENLFFNVPARRKFLKSNATELSHITTVFERIVLVNPHIRFTLHSNGTELFNLAQGTTRQRIIDIFGRKLNQELLPIKADTQLCRISGFIGKPESARKRGARQFFFVNGRYMKHPYFAKAVMSAYERLVPAGEQIPYFIYFDVNPQDIDVNIHPTKTEIKFENEQPIWQILSAAVRETFGKFNDVPSIDFDTQGKPDIPVFNPLPNHAATPKVNYNPFYNPFKEQAAHGRTQAPEQWEQIYEGLKGGTEAQHTLFPQAEEHTDENLISEKSPVHYQYKGQYIMTAVKSGLMIIDQHRAHIRILYEKYMQQLTHHSGHAQQVLFPETVSFPPSEAALLDRILPEMAGIGFDLTDLGGGTYAINGIPADIEGLNVVSLINEMVSTAIEQGTDIREDINHSLAMSLARQAAIPQGQVLNNDEMEAIVNALFACSNVNYTPTGKPVLCILEQKNIEQMLNT